MIKLSQPAADEIERLKLKQLKSQQQSKLLFRLAVKSGGCLDWFYDMSFDEEQTLTDRDRVFTCNDIQVVVDTETLERIQGLIVEYSEDLMGGGFRFYNPQAKIVCGCGNSFSMDSEQ